MNEASRIKKNLIIHKCYQQQQKIMSYNPKCQPKNPPNISQYHNQHSQTTKKKESSSRQNRYCPQMKNTLNENKNIQITLHREKEKTLTKFASKAGIQRLGNSKKEKKMQSKNHRNSKEIHHINKPRQLKSKNFNKENRPPRSTFQSRDQKASQASRMGKTQAYEDYEYNSKSSLMCHENSMHVKKIRRNQKNFSQDIPISTSFQQCHAQIKAHNTAHNTVQYSKRSQAKQMIKKLTPEEQLAEFHKQSNKMQSDIQSETLAELFMKEKSYFKTENFNCYIEKRQPNLTWFKRAIVINWMIEVSQSFGCKRQSFAIAVNILDRYLALSKPIQLSQLQRIACGSLCISNKIDGMIFNVKALSQQTENITCKEIIQLQQIITTKLQWKLNPPTANMWANRISLQWDMYLDHRADSICQFLQTKINHIKFKTEDTQGYNNYRSLMQYIDLSLMDVHTLRYHSRELAASFIYLILNLRLNLFEITEIYEKFPIKSDYLINNNQLNEFYCQFLMHSFGFTLQDLLPTIQFCSTFFILPLCFRLPLVVQQANDECDITFQQLCSYQTSNQSNLTALRKRDRQYD